MAKRRRLDLELVRRGLAASRASARELLQARRVTVGGAPATKASRLVEPGEAVQVLGPGPRYVGRGGHKLAGALERFAIDVRGLRGIDVGSSTGGFSDCLLQRGAAEVAAIDVGRNQLHERLRADPRVAVYERSDVRGVSAADIGGPGDIVVADLSFISVAAVADHIVGLAADGAHLVVLVKPQFEAGKAAADRGRGVIRDPEAWRCSLMRATSALQTAGAAIMGGMVSPLTGHDGNVEFFAHARVRDSADAAVATVAGRDAHGGAAGDAGCAAWIDAVVAEASEPSPQAGESSAPHGEPPTPGGLEPPPVSDSDAAAQDTTGPGFAGLSGLSGFSDLADPGER